MSAKPAQKKTASPAATPNYSGLVSGVSELLEAARRASARTVNAFMTATYWEVGRRIVKFEQGGEKRAEYGAKLIERLSGDLTRRFGRGFGQRNVECMRQFFIAVPCPVIPRRLGAAPIPQTVSAESAIIEKRAVPSLSSAADISLTPSGIFQSPSEKLLQPSFTLADLARAFPLPWSHYVLLISRSRSSEALAFYHTEALRGGWSVRQPSLDNLSLFGSLCAIISPVVSTPGAGPSKGGPCLFLPL
jgi:hypothetical protein